MTEKEKNVLTAHWLDLAKYDLKTAESLLFARRYPYALFLCHLAIEKILKARIVYVTAEHAPYTHNLVSLAEKSQLSFSEEQKKLVADLTEFNLEARYPDWKRNFYKRATSLYAREYVDTTQRLFIWIKKSLKK